MQETQETRIHHLPPPKLTSSRVSGVFSTCKTSSTHKGAQGNSLACLKLHLETWPAEGTVGCLLSACSQVEVECSRVGIGVWGGGEEESRPSWVLSMEKRAPTS